MTFADLMHFWARLRRYPFCIICAVVAIALAVASWFLWQQLQSLREGLAVKAKEGENMLATRVSGTILRADLDYLREFTRRIEGNLVVGEDRSGNQAYFYGIAGRASITEVQQFPADAPDTGAFYKRIAFSLKLTGTYEQLASFLHNVETGPRLAIVTAFSFRRGAVPSTPLGLDLTVELLSKR